MSSVVFLAGEPGIGKTWLLDRAAAHCSDSGATVLRGEAVDAEGMPPYLLFLEALGTHIRRTPADVLRVQAGDGARTLATILPEIKLKLVDLPSGMELPPEQARLRLYEAVSEFLLAITATAPLLLVMDDLQWADSATFDLLIHVTRRVRRAPMMFLGAYRPGEATENPAFQRAVAELTRQRVLIEQEVSPLAEGEITALAEGYLKGKVRADGARHLAEQSEGNPFVAEELLRAWIETGALIQHDQEWRLAHLPLRPLSPGLLATVRQRIGRLSVDVVEVLRVAAIIGRTFGVPLLAQVMSRSPAEVERPVLVAEVAHLVRETQPGTFQFVHDTIREALYQEIGSIERLHRHEAIGHALEAAQPASTSQRLAELAFHFARSADTARGVAYSCQAADRAFREHAFREAMAHCRAALQLLADDDPAHGELLLRYAGSARLAEAQDEAQSAYTEAQRWFENRGDRASAALAAHGLGLVYWRQEALHRAESALEAALGLQGETKAPEVVTLLVDLADLRGSSLSDYDAGLDLTGRALGMARELGDRRLEAAALRTAGRLHVLSNELPQGLPMLEDALDLLLAENDVANAAECCAALANAYHWSGQSRRSLALTERRVELAQMSHDPYQLRHVYSWSLFMGTVLGEWATAESMFARQSPVVERLLGQEPTAFLQVCWGFYLYHRGRYEDARDWLTRGLTGYRAFGTASLAWHLGLLGLTDAAMGDFRAARRCLDEQDELIAALPAQNFQRGCALGVMAKTTAVMRDRERAARYYPLLEVFSGLHFWFLVDRGLGALALCLGDDERAAGHLAAAEAMTRQAGLLPELARTLALRAELVHRQSRRVGAQRGSEPARELLAEASRLFAQLEMRSELAGARELLRRLPAPPDQGRRTLPAGLSAREAEVLRLVSAGMSNREIAQALFLSENTVAKHLTSIFNKTGSENRAAAATFAARQGLTD